VVGYIKGVFALAQHYGVSALVVPAKRYSCPDGVGFAHFEINDEINGVILYKGDWVSQLFSSSAGLEGIECWIPMRPRPCHITNYVSKVDTPTISVGALICGLEVIALDIFGRM